MRLASVGQPLHGVARAARDDEPFDGGDQPASPSAIGRMVRQMALDMEETDVIFLDPPDIFDDAIVGLTEGDLGPVRVIYDSEKCVAQLMKNGIGDEGDAREFFDFNTLGTRVEGCPLFLRRPGT